MSSSKGKEVAKDDKLPKAFRTHSRNSCQICKTRKTCELPNVEVTPSTEPLPPDLACRRCLNLKLPCVVSQPIRGSASKKTSTNNKRKRTSTSEGNGANSQSPSGSNLTLEGPSTSPPEEEDPNAAPSTLIHFWVPDGTPNKEQWKSHENGSQDIPGGNPRMNFGPDLYLLYPAPLALLNELIMRQPSFGRILPSIRAGPYDMERISTAVADSLELMEKHLIVVILWLPHLPTISTVRDEYQRLQTPENRLLLCSLYLITVPSSHPSINELRTSLRRIIQQDLLLVLMSSSEMNVLRTVQALQLVAVYTPISCTMDSEASLPVLSGSLPLSSAIHIASSMGLDQSLAELKRLKEAIALSGLASGFGGVSNLNQECSVLAEKAILWESLVCWDRHFRTLDRGSNSIPTISNQDDTPHDRIELEQSLISPFTHSSSSSDEAVARQVGSIAIKHRKVCLDLYLKTKPRLLRASQKQMGIVRGNELDLVLDEYNSLLARNDQAREMEFNSIAEERFTKHLANWCRFEASSVAGLLTSCAIGVLVKEMIPALTSPTAFFQELKDLNVLGWVARRGHSFREDQLKRLDDEFPSLSTHPYPKDFPDYHAFGSPPRSTCCLILFSAMQLTESSASIFVSFGQQLPGRMEPVLKSMSSSSYLLSKMDSENLTSGSGSIPKTVSKILQDMVKIIQVWDRTSQQSQASSVNEQRRNVKLFHDNPAPTPTTRTQPSSDTSHRYHQQLPQASTSNGSFASHAAHYTPQFSSNHPLDSYQGHLHQHHHEHQGQAANGTGNDHSDLMGVDLDGILAGLMWWPSNEIERDGASFNFQPQ